MSASTPRLTFINSSDALVPGRIICIGRNYAEHAREMGHDPEREPPFFFYKPPTALLPPGEPFIYPWYSTEVHHELELVILIGSGGSNLSIESAPDSVAGFAIGLDMTCRDVQRQVKQQGRPWDLAKGFDGSAPCSAIMAGSYQDLQTMGNLTLTRNGLLVQTADWRTMVWSVPELIVAVSRYTQLQTGDLLFTGTPAGVGPVSPGDQLVARLEGFPQQLSVAVAAAAS
jgi:fumarylpyruvate hydrolase